MSEQFKDKAHPNSDSLPPASDEQDVAVLIKQLQKQLIFLEKKIDTLISQSQARPSGEKHFSKPFRPFGNPHRSYDRGRDNAYGERGFGYKKKTYDNPRESDSGQGRNFEKRPGGESRGFDQKKKPFYHKRTNRA